MGPKKSHPIQSGPALARFSVTADNKGLLALPAPKAPEVKQSLPPITTPASTAPASTTPASKAPEMSVETQEVTAMDTSPQTGSMEDYLNRLISTTMTDMTISTGTPDLVYHIKCDNDDHKYTEDMQKGYFIIQGHLFIRKSVFQMNEISETVIMKVGCGFAGCTSSIEDALFQLSGQILCFKCRSTNSSVEMTEGREVHEDTKLTTLVFNALSSVVNHYYAE
jgi:hypothetical protein